MSVALACQPAAPRIGFLGVGWIGRNRMEALVRDGGINVVGIADPSSENLQQVQWLVPEATCEGSLQALLQHGLDGLVIATPSALHAEQAIAALEQGVAVFCQKPLGRNAAESRAVVDAARKADRLLDVDLSYRHTAAMQAIRSAIQTDKLGSVHAVDLMFHNAYGPDKPWFFDPLLSGGGCLIDLGVHLVDLALWALDFPKVTAAHGLLFDNGKIIAVDSGAVENLAFATLQLETGAVVRLACSWNLHVGCDALISADFHGRYGGARMRNVNGSFFDFEADLCYGTRCMRVASPPDDWGGRAAIAWAHQLVRDRSFDIRAEEFVAVAEALDRIYARSLDAA